LNCRITGPCRLVELGFTFLESVTQSRDLIGCVIRRAECIVYLFVCQLSQKVGQSAAIRYSYVVENVTTFAAREIKDELVIFYILYEAGLFPGVRFISLTSQTEKERQVIVTQPAKRSPKV